MRAFLLSILFVFMAILISAILIQFVEIIVTNKFSLGEFLYTIALLEIGYFVPYYIFFCIYELARKYVVRKASINLKLKDQFLLGFFIMLVIILFTAIITIVARDLSISDMPEYMNHYTFFVVFVPIIILISYLYRTRYNKLPVSQE